ncbi:hypothetical protein BVRB_9g213340 [Beta vulgaris subsp. vulgaris]|nr:hypothetical protein BVRB_9g213340 [Beta vulgaris subsp. vulgaris]
MSKVNAPEHMNELKVHSRLFSYNPHSSNFEIANGNAYFKVGQPGEKVVPGEKGSVTVHVVWA